MAKKRPVMPSKACVDPTCGATMHARVGVCPKCGKDQPSKTRANPKAQAAALRPQRPAAPQPGPGGLPQAVSFVRQVGGLDRAKKLLTEIEEIKKL